MTDQYYVPFHPITACENLLEHLKRSQHFSEVYQDDIKACLEACGIDLPADTRSPHLIVHEVLIPAIQKLRIDLHGPI